MTKQGPADSVAITTHGGARPGAGRKPLEGGRITATFVLRADQARWLDREAKRHGVSRSEVIRTALDRIAAGITS